jgi:hypothetical protein
MERLCAILLTICLTAQIAPARDPASSSWDTLSGLKSGARIEVIRKTGEPVRGNFSRFSLDSITVTSKRQDVAIPRAEVSKVSVKRKGRAKCIGLAIGAGAGAGAGAALGARLANESGGDLDLQSVTTAAAAAAGALIGLGIGAVFDSGAATVYEAN